MVTNNNPYKGMCASHKIENHYGAQESLTMKHQTMELKPKIALSQNVILIANVKKDICAFITIAKVDHARWILIVINMG